MGQERSLGDLTIADISHLVVDSPTQLGPDAGIPELLAAMVADLRTHNVYVVDEERRLQGCVRMPQVVKLLFPLQAVVETSFDDLLSNPHHLHGDKVRDLMVSPALSVRENTSLRELAAILIHEGVEELAVVDEQDRLVGEVNMYEIIQAYLAD